MDIQLNGLKNDRVRIEVSWSEYENISRLVNAANNHSLDSDDHKIESSLLKFYNENHSKIVLKDSNGEQKNALGISKIHLKR
jgi:hypothetical protein